MMGKGVFHYLLLFSNSIIDSIHADLIRVSRINNDHAEGTHC